jgi:hypothetical protein
MMTIRRYYRRFGVLLFVLMMVLVFAGCQSAGGQRDDAGLESSNPTLRIMAIKRAGDSKDSAAVPQLVDCLQNEDNSVRFYAVEALRRITGTDRGYDYKDPPQKRAAAVKRWQDFLATSGVTE